MFFVTPAQIEELTKIIYNSKDKVAAERRVNEIADALNETMDRYEINQTLRRVRYFVTQTLFETGNYRSFSENMNYSATRLVQVWPNRFTMDINDPKKHYAPDYAFNPIKMANLTYGNRMGNGGTDTNDGYDFRGSGAMQLTGRDNFTRCSKDLFGTAFLVENPNEVRDNMELAFLTAGWFWHSINGNRYADKDEHTKLTGAINGSTSTAPDRLITLRAVNRVITGK